MISFSSEVAGMRAPVLGGRPWRRSWSVSLRRVRLEVIQAVPGAKLTTCIEIEVAVLC